MNPPELPPHVTASARSPVRPGITAVAGVVACMIFTLFSTITMWVFSAAALANANEASIQRVKHWVLGFSSLSLVGLTMAGWLLLRRRASHAAIAALVPSGVMGGVLVCKLMA